VSGLGLTARVRRDGDALIALVVHTSVYTTESRRHASYGSIVNTARVLADPSDAWVDLNGIRFRAAE